MRKPQAKRPARPSENALKLAELMLYVAKRCVDMDMFGMVKLNKILFYSDFEAFAKLGKPISGARYVKMPQGPIAPQVLPIKNRLVRNGDAEILEKKLKNGTRQRLVALREPDARKFSGPELSIVHDVIDRLWNMNADEVSDLSHSAPGWRLAEMRKEIPYFTALLPVTPEPLSEEVLRFGRAVAAKRRAG